MLALSSRQLRQITQHFNHGLLRSCLAAFANRGACWQCCSALVVLLVAVGVVQHVLESRPFF